MLKPCMTEIGWSVTYRDAMDEIAKTAEEVKARYRWHPYPKEKPSEKGDYLIWDSESDSWQIDNWKDGEWRGKYCFTEIAWLNVEPYKYCIKQKEAIR